MSYRLLWGDLHSHCSISYGHGTVAQSLARARQQLDFCSITGHAFWPDMPTDRSVYAAIIDYHRTGFARLARNWDRLLALQSEASVPGEFLALPSYEWHSCEFGDHNVYAAGPELPLLDAADLPGLREIARQSDAILVPHHIGYAAGYRGIDWRHFREERSPLVEIFSLHGCSESDAAPYPMLHDMGPRDAGSTAEAGWKLGHRFGIIGSTDHHAGYPGSHGDGRVGVFANALTREALWEAFLARRVFAATGDKIDARLFVDGAWIGSTIRQPGKRRIEVSVQACETIDRVEVLKNGRIIQRYFPGSGIRKNSESAESVSEFLRIPLQHRAASEFLRIPLRLRITWGWGRKEVPVRWQARLELSEGEIVEMETCFTGPPIVAPQKDRGDAEIADAEDLPHAVTDRGPRHIAWRSTTTGNFSMRHATLQAISLAIDAPPSAQVHVEVNGQRYSHALDELLFAGRTHYLRGWLSEAIRIGPLVPQQACCLTAAFDDEPERDVDYYRLRVAQANGQWAWLTPVWVER